MNTLVIELADGSKHEIKPILADMVAYESTARKRGWGGFNEPTSQLTSASFMGWKALQRTGNYNKSFEDFLNDVVDIELPAEDGEDETPTGAQGE